MAVFHSNALRKVLPVSTVLAGLLIAIPQNALAATQAGGTTQAAGAADQEAVVADQAAVDKAIARGVNFLKAKGQAEDGSFSGATGVGPTGLVVSALLQVGLTEKDEVVARGLAYLKKHVQPDGGIYAKTSLHRNYDTCIAMVAFAKANNDGRYSALVNKAEIFVKGIQMDESEGKTSSDLDYGGAGYGKHQRPDLSNTSYLVDALHELGRGSDDEAMKKALAFVSRCQNLDSEHNDSPHAKKIDDGGFYYTVANGGETKAGTAENGGLRSYGSMTYAGLKSMIYAGVSKDDPRVKAASEFLSKHYSLEENPGMDQQGLFYYYQTMSKALQALGEEKFTDANGTVHDWKKELRSKLLSMQRPDGSWVNPQTRWLEGDPNLVTAYTLMALSHTKPN
ncbi:MAG: prenyltransferase/squalene oxidase repeat-containing protein [Planctomycetota bacterium]